MVKIVRVSKFELSRYFIIERKIITCILVLSTILIISTNILRDYDQSLFAAPNKDDSGKGRGNEGNDDKKGRDEGKGNDDKKGRDEGKGNEPREEPRDQDGDEDEDKVDQDVNLNFNYGFEDEGNNERKNFNFVAAGDFGCSQNTKNIISNMMDRRPELVLPLGDLSVDNTATCWLDLISPFYDKLQIKFGYHDVKNGETKLNQYKKAFDLDELYYSFDYRHVHFIVMSTLSDFNVTSDQYKFIEHDLKIASENEDIDWIVVTSYGPFYTSPSAHPAKNDIRNIYHPLFDRYGVDLVLQGHNHNYQRTYPITFNANKGSNPTVTNAFTTGYNGNTDGIVYAVVGTAGEGFHPLEGRQPYMATQIEGKFGFLDVEISNGNPHTNMTGTFYENTDNNVQDYFTIEKEIRNNVTE